MSDIETFSQRAGTSKRPVILVAPRYEKSDPCVKMPEPLAPEETAATVFLDAILAAGGLPLVMPLTDDDDVLTEMVAMADGIAHLTGGNHAMVIVIILWLSAVASAFVDNIPFAATMVPVILSLSSGMGVELNTLAWTLSMGTDIGGSATPIGASANVAGTSIAAREGHPISWGRYCKYSAPASVLVIAISMGMILLRY